MVKVPRVARRTIDGWPICSAGLPTRIVNGLQKTRLKTVGDLRQQSDETLQDIRGIGTTSLKDIHAFFSICAKIEKGALDFPDLRRLFAAFLTPLQYDILAARYGLAGEQKPPRATLQAAGTRHSITRERARQLEHEGQTILRSSLVRACLKGVDAVFEQFIRKHHGVAAVGDAAQLKNDPVLAGVNPQGLLALLANSGASWTVSRGFVIPLETGDIQSLRAETMAWLEKHPEPQPFAALLERLSPLLQRHDSKARSRIVQHLLDHDARLSATADDSYFLFGRGAPFVVRDILTSHGQPIHFRQVTREFNTVMRPGNRKGTGRLLDILRRSPLFSCIKSGYYQVKEGTEPTAAP